LNSAEKTYSLLGFSIYFGLDLTDARTDILESTNKVAALNWRGKHIRKAAEDIARVYPKLTQSKMKLKASKNVTWIFDNVGNVGGETRKLEVISSFLILGYEDLLYHQVNDKIKELLTIMIKKLQWLHDLVDPKLSEFGDYIRADHLYEKWTGEKITRIKLETDELSLADWQKAVLNWKVAA